ncbi:hypothetical protein Patl1_12792 [Pistacia atlantica]|uniref:Uncharacterized protein n=1 Tax=Pistacia atlantica TaxID=434234 RepID=A0ACC1AWL3_9ROSI|nr:hypothetical protein Patl1_12792 [Pistacia atlantica]
MRSLRYRLIFLLLQMGYCAWRGVLDYSGNENSETIQRCGGCTLSLGNACTLKLGSGTQWINFLYNSHGIKINPTFSAPKFQGNSVTLKVRDDIIKNKHQEAEKVWALELGKVMKETKCCSPQNTSWTEKHKHVNIKCSSLTKMCGEVRSGEFFFSALEEYQSILRPVTTKQVLPSQQLGRIKQGLTLPGRDSFSPKTASSQ